MKAALAVTLSHGPALGRVSPDLVLELIEATFDFDAAALCELSERAMLDARADAPDERSVRVAARVCEEP